MTEYTLVRPKIFEIIKKADLTDENEIMIPTKVMMKKSTKEIAASAVKNAAKAVVTSVLLGFYSMPVPLDFVITLKKDSLYLIQAPRRGALIERPSVKQKEIDNRIEIKKDFIADISFEKVFGGHKMHLLLSSEEIIIVDVTKKLCDGINKITTTLGFSPLIK